MGYVLVLPDNGSASFTRVKSVLLASPKVAGCPGSTRTVPCRLAEHVSSLYNSSRPYRYHRAWLKRISPRKKSHGCR